MGSNLGVCWSWQGHLPDPMKELPRVHPCLERTTARSPAVIPWGLLPSVGPGNEQAWSRE